jgi:hypothetical protein
MPKKFLVKGRCSGYGLPAILANQETDTLSTDRLLLLIYLAALAGLLFFPIGGPDFRWLGLDSDKWMHFVLFGGLALMLRWNLVGFPRPFSISVGIATVFAALTELGQALLIYRSAESQDFLAGLVGAVLGGAIAHFVLSSASLQRFLGLVVSMLGVMIGILFLVADLIGIGDASRIGPVQIGGIVSGGLIALGGARMQLLEMRRTPSGQA